MKKTKGDKKRRILAFICLGVGLFLLPLAFASLPRKGVKIGVFGKIFLQKQKKKKTLFLYIVHRTKVISCIYQIHHI